MKCSSKGCTNARVKTRTVCNACKLARENSPKVKCANPGCDALARIDGPLCRFCVNREEAMAESAAPNTTGESTCCHCKETKPVQFFNVNRGTPTGLDYTCKACRATRKTEKQGDRKEKQMLDEEIFGGHKLAPLLSRPMGAQL